MGDLKKNIMQTDFEGKSLHGYTWEKLYPAMEKISLMTYIMLKKNLTPLYVRKKILTSEIWEKNSCLNTSPIPRLPQQSDGQPHRRWGRIRNLTHQQMSSVKKMAGARSLCAGFLSSVGCEIRCPIHKSFYEFMLGVRHRRHGAFCVSRKQRLCRRLPRRISCIIHERGNCVYSSSVKQCLPSVNQERFPIQMTHKHNKWPQILAKGDLPPKSSGARTPTSNSTRATKKKTAATTERASLNEFRMLK